MSVSLCLFIKEFNFLVDITSGFDAGLSALRNINYTVTKCATTNP